MWNSIESLWRKKELTKVFWREQEVNEFKENDT